MEFLIAVLLVILYLHTEQEFRRLESRINELGRRLMSLEPHAPTATVEIPAPREAAHASSQSAEQAAAPMAPGPPMPPVVPVPPTPPVVPVPPVPPAPATPAAEARVAAAGRPRPATARPPRGLGDRLTDTLGTDWEAVIGGNWLNKLGALVLVVGIGLLLAYSVTHLGPAGRVALGLALSGAMLVAGVVLKQRDRYRVFAQGMIGGGWAGLYFTTFAMHGLPAARVVESPLVGTVLLLAVSSGMIAHSLRYRSQAVTGLTYFITFVTLTISPLSRFALFASVPVAVSLLFVARRFAWERMAVAGLVLSYGAFLFRYNGLQQVGGVAADWAFGQSLLLVYWAIFEAFDLFSAVRGRIDEIGYTLYPLNAAGFLGISIIEWSEASPANLSVFFALAGVAYLASALLRARMVPMSEAGADAGLGDRVAAVTYEASITMAAALLAFGVHLRFDGWQKTAAWLLEAQMLFLSGLSLRQPFLRRLASAAFVLPAVKIVGVDLHVREQFEVLGIAVRRGTPITLIGVGLRYLNRALLRVTKALRAAHLEHYYTYVGSLSLALVIGHEAPAEYAALGWLALAVPLFETSLFCRLPELRFQGYVVAAVAWIDLLAATVLGVAPSPERAWTLLVPAAVLSYGAAMRLYQRPRGIDEPERRRAFDVSSTAGTVLLGVLIWYVAPVEMVAVGWLLIALSLVEVGVVSRESSLRYQAYAVAAIAWIDVLAATVVGFAPSPERPWTLLLPAALLSYLAAARMYRCKETIDERERQTAFDVASLAGTVLTAVLIWHAAPAPVVAPGWLVLGLLSVEIGFGLGEAKLRTWGHIGLMIAFGRAFMANVTSAGATAGVSHRLLTLVPMIAGYYYASGRLRGAGDRGGGDARGGGLLGALEGSLSRVYLYLPVIIGTLLVRFELGRSPAVIGWMAMLLALLYLGLRRENADLRFQSYALAGLVFVRAWATNFYLPGTILGLSGRVFAGVVITTGLFAAHFLIPRHREPGPAAAHNPLDRLIAWLDGHARAGLSLLATVLLAAFLFYEVSGSWLTVAWGLQGTGLLLAGFALRDRQLRVSGLVLLGTCIVKAFFYDFRELETVFRIFSFMVLGSLLIAVSFVYSRFREQLQRLL